MKNITMAITVTLIIGMSSCADEKQDVTPTDCIECTGCFGNWTECKEDWQSADSITWEMHVQEMTSPMEGSSFSCTRMQ